MSLTINEWLTQVSAHQSNIDHPVSRNDLRLLLCHHLQCDSAWLYAHTDQPLSATDTQQLNQWLKQLQAGRPLAYITGQQMFWDLLLQVNSSTLIPRPDTETVIETAIDLMRSQPPQRILDLGTGSGALALALARVFPGAQVTATDVCKDALDTAINNAQNHAIDNCQFILSNWFDQLPKQTFDLIVSNPPYIAADDVHLKSLTHEPIRALVAENNGLADFTTIGQGATEYLSAGGWLVLEHGWQQQAPVCAILQQAGFNQVGSRHDLAGHVRVSYGQRS